MPTYTPKTITGVLGLGIAGVIAHNALAYHHVVTDHRYFDHLAFLGNDDPILGALILLGSVCLLASAALEYYQKEKTEGEDGEIVSKQEQRNHFWKRPEFYATCAATTLICIGVYGLLVGALSYHSVDMRGVVSEDMGLNPADHLSDGPNSIFLSAFSFICLVGALLTAYTRYPKKFEAIWLNVYSTIGDEDDKNPQEEIKKMNQSKGKPTTLVIEPNLEYEGLTF